LNKLIAKFTTDIHALHEWCEFNRIDINWSKTFIMFVTNKRIKPPKEIMMNGSTVAVVSTFKLLGVTLDNKLKFDVFTAELRKKIFIKMYSIKKLFQLCHSVKLQFFKSFMQPYFDYCSTLSIYFAKTALQRMCNCFNLCLFKLFKIKNEASDNNELNEHNNKLESFGLFAFEHRLVARLATFAQKITNSSNAPVDLKALLRPKNVLASTDIVSAENANTTDTQDTAPTHNLRTQYYSTITRKLVNINSRHANALAVPLVATAVGASTFSFFFSTFINNICLEDINQRLSLFKTVILNNINILFLKFVVLFPKFDLRNKNFDYLLKKKPVENVL
jgi:hypothetical protein